MIKNFIAELIHVTNRLKAKNIEVEEELITKTLGSKNLSAEKDLIVNENSNLKGNVAVGKNLTVNGTSTLKDNVTAEKTLTVNGTSTLKDNVTAEKTLTVNGASVLKGDVAVEKKLTINGTSTLKDNVTVEKTLTVNGTSTLKDNVTAEKALTVKGDIAVSGKISGIGFSGGEILSGGNDYAGLDKYNNIAIKSWWGISFSTLCTGQKFSSTPAVSIDCRDGHIYAGGNLNVSGSINVAYPNGINVRHVDGSNGEDLYLNYNNPSKKVYIGGSGYYIENTKDGSYYNGKSENSNKFKGYELATNANPWGGIPLVSGDGVMEIGRYIDFHTENVDKDYDGRLEYNSDGLVLNGHVIMSPSGAINDPTYFNFISRNCLDCYEDAYTYELSSFFINSSHQHIFLLYANGCPSSSTDFGTDDMFALYMISMKYYKSGSYKITTKKVAGSNIAYDSNGNAKLQEDGITPITRFSFKHVDDDPMIRVRVTKGSYVEFVLWQLCYRLGGIIK